MNKVNKANRKRKHSEIKQTMFVCDISTDTEEELKKQNELVEYISKYPIDDEWLMNTIEMRAHMAQAIYKELGVKKDDK